MSHTADETEFDEAVEISEWLNGGEEWLEVLPEDALVDVGFLMLQFGVEEELAQELLDLWADMLEPIVEER